MFGVTITDLRALPPSLAEALLAELQRQLRSGDDTPALPSSAQPAPPSARQGPRALSDAEAEAFMGRLRSKNTLAVVDAIIQLGPRFRGEELDLKLQQEHGTTFTVGAAGGLTKAIRQVTGDPKAEFVHWAQGNVYTVAEETLAALRRVLVP